MSDPRGQMRPKAPKSLVGNTADAEQVREAGKKEQLADEFYLRTVALIMASKEGRRFVYRQLARSNMFGLIFTGSTNDTMFNLGMREMGKLLVADIDDAAPDFYQLMIQEAKAQEAGA